VLHIPDEPDDRRRVRTRRLARAGGAAFLLALGAYAALHPSDTPIADTITATEPEPAPPRISAAELAEAANPRRLALRSEVALVLDADEGIPLYELRSDRQRPIASLTKLMTAIVLLDAGLPGEEAIAITGADRDRLRGSRSRLGEGSTWTRRDLLIVALGASDNRAAAALARTYPGGTTAFVKAMNARAAALGMKRSRFTDASGLSNGNVSTARDLAVLAREALRYPFIRDITAASRHAITDRRNGREFAFFNTNRLARSGSWNVELGKTGYTADAGYCLLMQATVGSRDVVIVLLNAWGSQSKYGDSQRIRDWLLRAERRVSASTPSPIPRT
jgi:D-alanyl-D-alanine endopeptidase (penicillin-binding protein 7)